MTPTLVSIIMPAYNGEAYIAQAIDSVRAQQYENWELIVVDDGSTDTTAQIVSAYEDPRIHLNYQENRGQAAALNHGLDRASGEFITTLDVDDWLTPNSLLDRVRFLEQHPEFGAVYGDGYYCDGDGKPICRFSEYRVGNVDGDVYDVLIATPFFGTGANVMVRSQVFEVQDIRYDESIVWCQDYDFYIRLAEKTSFGVIDAVLLWYRLHEANMTMSMPVGQRLESLIRTKFKVLASPRFPEVAEAAKVEYFYTLLSGDLQDRLDDQTFIFQHPQFQTLPKKQRAKLLRIVANDYLLIGENLPAAREWLKQARSLAPFDLKTISASAMIGLNPSFTKLILKSWRQASSQKQAGRSPFELVRKV